MPFTFTPDRARPPRGRRITKVDDNGLVIQSVSVATTQPAEAAGVIFIMEFSWMGLIAVFVLVLCVGARANSQHSANINHADHTLLFSRRRNVWLVSTLQDAYLLLTSVVTLQGRRASLNVVWG